MTLKEVPNLCFTSEGATALKAALGHAYPDRVITMDRGAVKDLNVALGMHQGGPIELPNNEHMRDAVLALLEKAAGSDIDQALRIRFRSLRYVVEGFGRVLDATTANDNTKILKREAEAWRDQIIPWHRVLRYVPWVKSDPQKVLCEEVFAPVAELVFKESDVITYAAAEIFARYFVYYNLGIVGEFGKREDLKSQVGGIRRSMWTLLGMKRLFISLRDIHSDLFDCDLDKTSRAVASDDITSLARLVSIRHRLSGLFMVSTHGKETVRNIGKAEEWMHRAEYVERDKARRLVLSMDAVELLEDMGQREDLVAERGRLRVLSRAVTLSLDNMRSGRRYKFTGKRLRELAHEVMQMNESVRGELIVRADKDPGPPSRDTYTGDGAPASDDAGPADASETTRSNGDPTPAANVTVSPFRAHTASVRFVSTLGLGK